MNIVLAYLVLILLAGWARFQLGLTQGCLYVGREISNDQAGTGLQDAVTPPRSSTLFLICVTLSIGAIAFQFWYLGVWHGVGGIVAFAVASIMAGAIGVPKPNAPFWTRLIYRSLVRRMADYERGRDNMRSEAVQTLIGKMEERFAKVLVLT